MSDARIAELYEKLVAGRFEIKGPKIAYPFQLGWNACIDFVIKQMRIVCDEPTEPEKDAA